MKKDTLHPIHRFYDIATDKLISRTTVNFTLPLTQLKLLSNRLKPVIRGLNTPASKLYGEIFSEYEGALKNIDLVPSQDLPYRADVRFVDLNGIKSGVRHSYSASDGLIKYSKREHSPVSSKPSDFIQLGTPYLYEGYEKDSGLVKDDSEGKYKENLNWRKWGSKRMEDMKKNYSSLGARDKIDLSVTWGYLEGFWLYCTSIDPKLSQKRKEQMKKTDPEYDFTTKIENPAAFAEQLGHDFGKQIESGKDLKCTNPGLHMLFSTLNRLHGQASDLSILVDHGPVIYLEEEKSQEFINYASERTDLPVILFVKDIKYELQQEYRFVIKVAGHSPKKDKFYLKVSEAIRKLMLPI